MISVCVATYNGEKYIREQLDSILINIGQNDELIISDDGSTDRTYDILQEYANKHTNCKCIKGPGKGVIKNFECALLHSSGDIIFLADQDDIWEKNKVERILTQFKNPNVLTVVHDAIIVDCNGKMMHDSIFKIRGSRIGFFKNLIKNSYIGCCMAIRRELLKESLPFPEDIEMHDWWIGLISECKRGSVFVDEKLIKYRRHENNVSPMHHYSLYRMLKNRYVLLKKLIGRMIFDKRNRNG